MSKRPAAVVLEAALWITGVLCVAGFAVHEIRQQAHAQEAVATFHAERALHGGQLPFSKTFERVLSDPNQSLWSEARIDTYEEVHHGPSGALAVLRVPRLSLEAPVFEGATDSELDLGPGWIRGTGPIGSDDNVGIAGHRDGFFRALKNIQPGDSIELLDRESLTLYRVTDTWIVDPDAVQVLDPTGEPSLTLVTCYPFYYVGHAPQRFIVRAVAQSL